MRQPPRVTEAEQLSTQFPQSPRAPDRPVLIALDERSGAGKFTLAAAFGDRPKAMVVEGDKPEARVAQSHYSA